MQRIVNPKQTRLFDPFDNVLTEKKHKRLLDGWAGVFRHIILELMPVETISGHFDPAMGRPTKFAKISKKSRFLNDILYRLHLIAALLVFGTKGW